MKKLLRIGTLILLTVCLFVSCNKGGETSGDDTGGGNQGGSGGGNNGSGGGDNGNGGSGNGNDDMGGGETEPKEQENYLFRVRSDKTGTLYLRQENMGTYTGKGEHGFSSGNPYAVENAIDPSEYFAYALAGSGVTKYQVEVEIKAELSRLFPYYQNKIYESENYNLGVVYVLYCDTWQRTADRRIF